MKWSRRVERASLIIGSVFQVGAPAAVSSSTGLVMSRAGLWSFSAHESAFPSASNQANEQPEGSGPSQQAAQRYIVRATASDDADNRKASIPPNGALEKIHNQEKTR